jgi:hypothetical protein
VAARAKEKFFSCHTAPGNASDKKYTMGCIKVPKPLFTFEKSNPSL